MGTDLKVPIHQDQFFLFAVSAILVTIIVSDSQVSVSAIPQYPSIPEKVKVRRVNISDGTTAAYLDVSTTDKSNAFSRNTNISETDESNNKEPSTSQKREISKLPLEHLFSNISTSTSSSVSSLSSSSSMSVSTTIPSLPKVNQTETMSPEELIKKALLNHTLLHGAEEDLDRLVFSQLPEGSRLILRSVKIVKTDENGDTIEDDDDIENTAWDVTFTNATDNIYDAEEGDVAEEEDDSYEDERENVADDIETGERAKNDLLSSGSHPSHATANYKVYGTNEKQKEKNKNYYHGNDQAKHHKLTDTDTVGTKVKNYKGTEKGLTDYDNSHGNAQSNEGGRYKDSKKKNKRRKVTGFKRVYHKEEFQRTEHFYDDEEAKRIAENYGLHDQKDKSNQGVKDDDRKYHGTYKEHTDGDKVKNEHGTHNGYDKGQKYSNTESEKHKHAQHYGNHHSHNNLHTNPRPRYHPNHNYKGSYSNSAPVVHSTDASIVNINSVQALPLSQPTTNSFTLNEYSESTDVPVHHHAPLPKLHAPSSTHHPMALMDMEKPEEMKMFFSPRERFIPMIPDKQLETPYAPNFAPQGYRYSGNPNNNPLNNNRVSKVKYRHPNNVRANSGSPFYNKIGDSNSSYTGQQEESVQNDRYAQNYQTSSTTIRNTIMDPVPAIYSTIVKVIPGKYYNYTELHNSIPKGGNLISIDKANSHEISITTSSPTSSSVSSLSNSLSNENWHNHLSHENEEESQNYPNHNYEPRIRTAKKLPPIVRSHRRPVNTPQPIHYSINVHSTGPGPVSQNQPSSPTVYKSRRVPPPYPQFISGLMDSVANFFGKIG